MRLNFLNNYFLVIVALGLFGFVENAYSQNQLSQAEMMQIAKSDPRAIAFAVGRGFGPDNGISMNPSFRIYLEDVKGGSNYYTTKEDIKPGGEVWVAYEISGVTLTNDASGGVDLDVALWKENASVAAPEKISFGVYKMTNEIYRSGQSAIIKQTFNPDNNYDLAKNAREIYGSDGFERLMKRLDDKESYKRAVVVRKYTPKPGVQLGFQVGFGKGENFVPLVVRLSAFHTEEDLLRVFNKISEGSYVHQEVKNESWFNRNKGILILILCIAVFFGARAVIARKI